MRDKFCVQCMRRSLTSGKIVGTVSVGMAYSAAKAIGAELVDQGLSRYPNIDFLLTESLSGATLVSLMTSDVDLALIYNPPDDPTLKTEAILE